LSSKAPHDACNPLRGELELYAEGELRNPYALERVRAHLDVCPACQERLAEHDELTAMLLGEGVAEFESEARVERIAARVESFAGAAFVRPRRPPARARAANATSALRPRRFSWKAAASIAAAALFAVALTLSPFRNGEDTSTQLARGAESALPADADGGALANDVADAGSAVASSGGAGSRWTLDAAPQVSSPHRSSRSLLRLYESLAEAPPANAKSPPPAPSLAPSPSLSPSLRPRLPWVVDAQPSPGPKLPSRDRYYLVAEDAVGSARTAPLEIRPVGWFPSRRDDVHEPVEARDGPTVYRIYTLPGAAALEADALPDGYWQVRPMRILEPMRREPPWVLPPPSPWRQLR